MEKRNFVVFDEIIQGVVSASDEVELKSKITTLLDGIREPIEKITLPSFNDFNDMEAHEITVEYDGEEMDDEEFFVQRVNII